MYNLETIEYALVAAVILLQLMAFARNWRRIAVYRHIIPTKTTLFAPGEPLIAYPEMKADGNKHRVEMVNAINGYLDRNKGSAPDFNLVKDIVERNSQVLEEEISQTTSVPLYLGLMGTMVGIVAGLWNMSDISAAINTTAAGDRMGDSINVLLGGVKIAMVASFMGILLTVLSSSYLFNRARKKVEGDKNRFYTFIQTELLPVITKDVTVAMQSLQNNMVLFSERFENSLRGLEGLLNKNHDALIAQERILTALENIDVNSFVKGNVKMMQELRQSMEQLQRFNQYLDKLNDFTGASQRFATGIDGILTRTANIEDVLQNIDAHFGMSADLLSFLSSHFKQLEARGVLIQDAVVKMDTVLDNSFNELREHIQGKIQAIKDITIAETGEFSRMLEQSRGGLGKLTYLENIYQSVNDLRTENSKNSSSFLEVARDVHSAQETCNNILGEMKDKKNSILSKIKWLFKKPSN
jgi:hypothetical protein